MSVTAFPFGKLPDGTSVRLFRIDSGGLSASFLEYGCILHSLIVPDRDGHPTDVALGYDSLREYEENDGCMGGVIGRIANRIGNARFRLDGTTFVLPANEGKNHLHGGVDGFHRKVWEGVAVGADSVRFRRVSRRFPNRQEVYIP